VTTVNFPTALEGPFYVLAHGNRHGADDDETGWVHQTRGGAEGELAEWNEENRHFRVTPRPVPTIQTLERVFVPQCVVCGATRSRAVHLVIDRIGVFDHWWELEDMLRDYPGWTATSEQHVYCPDHAPSKED
jgi:hypothetical protein